MARDHRALVQRAHSATSYRKRYMFWLDIAKNDQFEIAEDIERLKARSMFSRAIRDGLRLFVSFMAGDTSVLRELFPRIVETIQRESDNAHIRRLQAKIERLEAKLDMDNHIAPQPKRNKQPQRPAYEATKVSGKAAADALLDQLDAF